MPPGSRTSTGEQQPGVDTPPKPTIGGTGALLAGLVITWGVASGEKPSQLLSQMAWGVGISLGISFLIDMQHGLRNMVRADIIALMAIYGLCFAEFLFPFELYDIQNSYEWSKVAGEAVMLAMAIFALGRHLGQRDVYTPSNLFIAPVSPQIIVRLFWAAFAIGYFHQWLGVDFNPVRWLDAWTGKRWSQPWQRAHFGGWKALIYELSLFQYVVTPLGAIIMARKNIYGSSTVRLVSIVVLLNIFHAFAGGTRHIFCVHMIMFTIPYCYFQALSPKMIAIYLSIMMGIIFISTNTMLAFRQLGLKQYMELKSAGELFLEEEEKSLKVDMTLQNLNWLMEAMPARYDYLGMEIPWIALTRPIPRAIWKGKPTGLSVTLEEVLFRPGAAGTWSVTLIGESYMAAGYLGITIACLFFGWASNRWNSFGSPKNSDLGILIFASGFFSFAIAMRSLYTFTTAILPTLAMLFFASYLMRNRHHILPVRR
jgi:hypothetical protein